VIWECSEGKFNWFYDRDETLYVFEGSVVLDEGLPTERHVGAGDLVFFPAGSRAHWHITKPVRKLAFVRRAMPGPLATGINVLRKLKHLFSPGQESPFGAFDGANLGELPAAAQSRP
jgi:mannose-6-phosphate isomerase-like protein (cupin superfamily)